MTWRHVLTNSAGVVFFFADLNRNAIFSVCITVVRFKFGLAGATRSVIFQSLLRESLFMRRYDIIDNGKVRLKGHSDTIIQFLCFLTLLLLSTAFENFFQCLSMKVRPYIS